MFYNYYYHAAVFWEHEIDWPDLNVKHLYQSKYATMYVCTTTDQITNIIHNGIARLHIANCRIN